MDDGKLELSRREIKRSHQQDIRDVSAIEQTFNERFLEMNQTFEDAFLQLSNLQLRISNLQSAIEEKKVDEIIPNNQTENESITKKLMNISSRLDNVCSKLNLNLNASVILLGGWHSSVNDSICMFNSKENKWIGSHLKLPDKLGSSGSVILDGEIYIFGGWNGNEYFKSTYKLGENEEWIELADMNEKRSFIERSSVVFEDEIWVFGGSNEEYNLRTVEKYNPQKNSWTMMPEMNEARNTSAVSIINGKFYVSGGHNGGILNTIEVYDPENEKWEIFSNMPLALVAHTSIVDGTNLIIIGGCKSDVQPSDEVWKIDVMDPQKEWKKMPNLQQPRYHHGAVQLEDGLMVIGGGIDNKTVIDSVEIFDGQKWTEGPKLQIQKRAAFSLIPLPSKDEKIFLQRFCKS